jgi:hypothetical protein
MRKDPIVEEVRRVREQHAAKFGYDLDAIVRDLRKNEKSGDWKYVRRLPKRLRQAAVTSAA